MCIDFFRTCMSAGAVSTSEKIAYQNIRGVSLPRAVAELRLAMAAAFGLGVASGAGAFALMANIIPNQGLTFIAVAACGLALALSGYTSHRAGKRDTR